ncbi:MAG TPA: hypothetical protein DCS17_09855 [Flavobacterium sp.]|nr:hypothetical protein [Flavobacterium sp.]
MHEQSDSKAYVKIHPRYIVTYQKHEGKTEGEKALRDMIQSNTETVLESYKTNFSDNRSFGIISDNARKRMKNGVNYMLYVTRRKQKKSRYTKTQNSEYKITFATLTLPAKQNHTDNEIKKHCLNHLFTLLRQKYHIQSYIWKAEAQENKNIHFHIVLDRYIPYLRLRQMWNEILNKGKVKGVAEPFDYVDRYQNSQKEFFKDGFKIRSEMLFRYNKKTQKKEAHWTAYKQQKAYNEQMILPEEKRWTNPNSTDIHALKKIRSINAYLSQYMAKNEDELFLAQVEEMRIRLRAITARKKELAHEIETCSTFGMESTVFDSEMDGLQREEQEIEARLSEFRFIEGKIWYLSQELSALIKGAKSEMSYAMINEMPRLFEYLYAKGLKENREMFKESDFFTILFIDPKELEQLQALHLLNLFSSHVDRIIETKIDC